MPSFGTPPETPLLPSTDGPYDTLIFRNVSTLVHDALKDVETWNSELMGGGEDYYPNAPLIPRSTVNVPVSDPLPNVPGFSPVQPEKPNQITGVLESASYNALSTLVGTFQTPVVGSPTYETPVDVPPESVFDLPTADTNYPEASFISVDNSAGLTPAVAPDVEVGVAPTFNDVEFLSYEPEYLSSLSETLPPLPALPQADPMGDPEPLEPLSGELIEKIRATLEDTTLLSIQDVLQYLGTKEVKRERLRAEHKLFADAAERGFSAETGTLYGAIEDLDYESSLKYVEVQEKARQEVFEAGREKMLTAIEQGIKLETANFARHLSYCQKLVEVFEINIRLHVGVFDTVVSLYNAQVRALEVLLGAYNTYVSTNLGQYDAALAAADQIKGVIATNAAKIDAYSAQVRTEGVRADVYSTDVEQRVLPIKEYELYIKGLMQNVEIAKENVKAYRQAIGVASEAVKIDKARASEYEARVTTAGSVGQVYKANWDAYSGALNVVNGVNDAAQRFNSAALQSLRSEIGVYKAAAAQQRSYLDGINRLISANNGQLSDWLNGVNAAAQYMGAKNNALQEVESARANIELTQADMVSLQQALDAQRDAAQATIDGGLATAEATTLSGLAQAAYSIRSISTSLGSSTGHGYGKSFNTSASESTSYGYSESKSRNKTLSA